MKPLILICILAVVGCSSQADMDSDAFSQGDATQEQFQADNNVCKAEGEQRRSWSLRGSEAANTEDQHVIFNRAYMACMLTKGYRERTSVQSLWQPHDL